ncbi:MAG: putative monovalent cation/H+ antiporter subunit A [Pseudomonadota bacterium]
MLAAVVSGFIVACFAPLLARRWPLSSGWILGALPAGLFVYFFGFVEPVIQEGPRVVRYAWWPGLDLSLDFLIDGLSLLFGLLISGIGALVLVYSGSFLRGNRDLARLYFFLLCFMASMLGLVFADNLITLFVFWELTSITSYMLIGFNHENTDVRRFALQGLFVTTGGGLAMLAGLIMLAQMGGSYSLSELLAGEALHQHPWYAGMLVCLLLGAFSKSAQVPMHFWLPNAMAAPTPVSAYLHSATMVKAGIYLLARLNPALGEGFLWTASLTAFGAATMLLGASWALTYTPIKKVLANSTLMALGLLTMLIGVGGEAALTAFVCFLLAHALYKGALFLLAGATELGTGSKDMAHMGGLHRTMPLTALLTVLAALSLAGLPPLFGFVAKELVLEALLAAPLWSAFLLVATVAAAALMVAVAFIIVVKPFLGETTDIAEGAREVPPAMLVGPAVLSLLALVFGVAPVLPEGLLAAAVEAVSGERPSMYLALWHGFNLPLLLSAVSLALGALLAWRWSRWVGRLASMATLLARLGPQALYFRVMDWIPRVAAAQTRFLQNGVLGLYMVALVSVAFATAGYTLYSRYAIAWPWDISGGAFYEWGIVLLMLLSAGFATFTGSRLGAVASMGVFGFTVALIFILFSAPDLGITQLLIETLTVILLVLVLFRLPEFVRLSSTWERWRDIAVAAFAGLVMTQLVLAAIGARYYPSISDYFVENSAGAGHGLNIVNVILVDFRALDTLGEIFVLALAAMGVYSMLKLKPEGRGDA